MCGETMPATCMHMLYQQGFTTEHVYIGKPVTLPAAMLDCVPPRLAKTDTLADLPSVACHK